MACDCDKYIDCGDTAVTVGVADESGVFGHTYDNTVLSDDVLEYYQKTTRNFNVSTSWDRDVNVGYMLLGCSDEAFPCEASNKAIASSSCSEYCKRETNVPYFWDTQRGIYVWKHCEEELTFSVSSHKTAAFKLKWGIGHFHKICIKKTVRTKGKEQFFMVLNGVKKLLAEVSYDYNPFPETESGGATWGLYGNTVTRQATPDTEDVSCILLFPNVPKLAIPYDNDVIAYGFYDYNVTEGGFTESSLPRDDGGKDYFYPYWCRAMPIDPLWRSTADQRYDVIYSKGHINLNGVSPWSAPSPVTFPFPFGSFVMDTKGNFIVSCLLQFSSYASLSGVAYSETNFGDLHEALTKFKIPLSLVTTVYPTVAL